MKNCKKDQKEFKNIPESIKIIKHGIVSFMLKYLKCMKIERKFSVISSGLALKDREIDGNCIR